MTKTFWSPETLSGIRLLHPPSTTTAANADRTRQRPDEERLRIGGMLANLQLPRTPFVSDRTTWPHQGARATGGASPHAADGVRVGQVALAGSAAVEADAPGG